MAVPDAAIAHTSIYRSMQVMMFDTHQERGISVLSGPPGIGKTTAIDAFAGDHRHKCLVAKIMPMTKGGGASPVAVLQALIERFCHEFDWVPPSYLSSSLPHLTREFRRMVAETMVWSDAAERRLTLIFDEAQYLTKVSIEMLRFWNDPDRGVMPFQIGLVFVGNNEFALAANRNGESVLSDAVRDRALHFEQLGYNHLSDADLRAVANARGIADESAMRIIIQHFTTMRLTRSLRQFERIIARCTVAAGGGPVTAQLVNNILNPQ